MDDRQEMTSTKKWPGNVMVGFGFANIAYAVAGLALQLPVMFSFHSKFAPDPSKPYFFQAFYIMSSVEMIFCIALGIIGVFLTMRNLKAVLWCDALFVLEVLFFVATAMLWIHPTLGMSVGAATGIGGMGLVLQIITGYPVIAGIALTVVLFAARRGE